MKEALTRQQKLPQNSELWHAGLWSFSKTYQNRKDVSTVHCLHCVPARTPQKCVKISCPLPENNMS